LSAPSLTVGWISTQRWTRSVEEMPESPWLAIDAATPPALRARELRREWERFVSGGSVSGVRRPVADSWRRSLDAGIDPAGSRLAPAAADRDETSARFHAHPLGRALPLIRDCLGTIAGESEHLIVVSDAAGVLLELEGDAQVRSQAADSMNFTVGALWSESGAGTNAVGTAVATDHAVQIFATEHFVEVVQAWTCWAAPVHDPETGELLGIIDLTGLRRHVHPHTLAVVTTTARAVEGYLRHLARERDDRLRARFAGALTGSAHRRALFGPTGQLVVDDARGWLRGARLALPPGGGEVVLPSGAHAIAEPVGADEAFIVREVAPPGTARRRDRLQMLADEQAALRRLAAAVAQDASPTEIFTAVAAEIGPLLGADGAGLVRYESDRTATVVAGTGTWTARFGPADRVDLHDSLAITSVRRTGRSARVDERDRGAGNRSAVASPIVVDGRLWGAMVVSTRRKPLAPDTERRMANVTELVGMVIANAEHRAELTASRARVVAAGDEARRRIQRDLHDGAQQRLVTTVMTLELARRELGDAPGRAAQLLEEALAHAQDASGELRELAHGILPAALSRGGLLAGVHALVARIPLPVSLDVTAERLPPPLEATGYFIVAEALTNAVKHARASSARVAAVVDRGVLWLEVRDDGVGGARADGSSGLVGLRDRAAALDGELHVESPPGAGTVVSAMLPIPASQAA
jgi:signal transduction histidine kinase